MRLSRGRLAFQVFNYALLTLVVATTLYPFMNQVTLSLSTTRHAYSPGIHFLPRLSELTGDSYSLIFRTRSIWTGFLNSIIRTAGGTALALAVYGLTAYPLSKRNLPGFRFFTFLFVFTMLFDGGVIPNYLLIRNLGLMNTRFALIVQGAVSTFNIIIIRNFFKSIPESLEESARMEGAGDITIYFRIILPLSLPVMATIGLWVAVWHWNSWFDALLYISNRQKQVLQIILREILIQTQTEEMVGADAGFTERVMRSELLKYAVIIIASLPMIVLYPFLQRFFVKGVMIGAIKG